MEKLQDMVIADNVQKLGDKMEAVRCVSYPYAALEEAVVNAFYHRDYMSYEPVHIEIEPDCINIISYPGIDRSVPMDVINRGERFRSRTYRNRRLGEFLKELDLTEGKCTGVPTIQEELGKNGSPRAVFDTDEDRRALCVTIPIHPSFSEGNRINNERSFERSERSFERSLHGVIGDNDLKKLRPIIEYLESHDGITPHTAKSLTEKSDATVRRYMKILVECGAVEITGNTNNVIYLKKKL